MTNQAGLWRHYSDYVEMMLIDGTEAQPANSSDERMPARALSQVHLPAAIATSA
jgi:hypothetical protein